ncbi:MAG: RNA 2',3'-cyclic phosphodiesterase [Hyphomicrobiaceae bacterium]
MPRLFTAIEVPETVRRRLSLIRGNLPEARWIDQDNYHLTLTFVGEVDGHQMRAFSDALYEISAEPFELTIDGLGCFGGDRPRTIYAAIRPEARLDALKRDHDQAARRAGLAPDSRKFVPHVTLARLSGASSRMVADFLADQGSIALPPFPVSRFALMSSKPGGGGPYAVVTAFDLGGVDYSEEAAAWAEHD